MFRTIDPKKFDIAIPHRNWQRVLAEAFAILACASPGEVVCITGPSRAGKSLLIRRLEQLLVGESQLEATGTMSSVIVRAVNAGPHGAFSTKSFTQRLLNALKHPFFSIKGRDLDDLLAMQKTDRTTEAALRLTLEEAMVERKLKYLFIDEAQHVRYSSKDAQAAYAVMDSWKCLAESTGVVLVVVGAYPVLDVIGNSSHLVGRNHQVHFPRYYANQDDIMYFGQILQKYSELIQLHESLQSLNDIAELMYEGSFGCIGLLKAWVKRVDAIATVMNTPIDEKLLRDQRQTDHNLRQIMDEIQAGERLLARTDSSAKAKGSNTRDASKPGPNLPKPKSKPFQRKPVRHTAGNRTEVPPNV